MQIEQNCCGSFGLKQGRDGKEDKTKCSIQQMSLFSYRAFPLKYFTKRQQFVYQKFDPSFFIFQIRVTFISYYLCFLYFKANRCEPKKRT
jgi:hypothetical protein